MHRELAIPVIPPPPVRADAGIAIVALGLHAGWVGVVRDGLGRGLALLRDLTARVAVLLAAVGAVGEDGADHWLVADTVVGVPARIKRGGVTVAQVFLPIAHVRITHPTIIGMHTVAGFPENAKPHKHKIRE
jgi:hypothetical protein